MIPLLFLKDSGSNLQVSNVPNTLNCKLCRERRNSWLLEHVTLSRIHPGPDDLEHFGYSLSLFSFLFSFSLIQVTSREAISATLHAFFPTAASTGRHCGHRASFHGLLLHCTSPDLPLSHCFFRYLIQRKQIHRAMPQKSKTKSSTGRPSTQ